MRSALGAVPALVLAVALAAMLVAQPAAQALVPGYWDITAGAKIKGRGPMLVGFGGQLWMFYQGRSELVDLGINIPGRRGNVYFSTFNGTNWTAPFNLTPATNDIQGIGIQETYATEYGGKLYLTAEAVEPSLKDDDQNDDYDIVLRAFDGRMWNPQPARPWFVVSERFDGNFADFRCRSIVFQDRLYLMWLQIPGDPINGTIARYYQLLYRTFDGSSWGPIGTVAVDGQSQYGPPTLAVHKGKLYAAFASNSSSISDQDILVCSTSGGSWTAPARVNPAVEGSPAFRVNLNPQLESHGDRLWVVWQSADPIAKSGTDYDLLASSFDGSAWSWPVELNRPSDAGDDITPDIKACNGTLYVAWVCTDPGTTDGGSDRDIVLRSFNGTGWGPISLVSPYGDNGTIEGDHNPGDDDEPQLCAWNSSLFCTWMAYDQEGVGHKGGKPSVIVRQVTNRVDYNLTPPDIFNDTAGNATGNDLTMPLVLLAVVGIGGGIAVAVVPPLVRRRKDEGAPLTDEEE